MKIVIRWRVVHPAKKNPISYGPSVIFEEVVNDRRDRIRSCSLEAWPSMKERLAENGYEFEQLPDVEESSRPEPAKRVRRTRR